MEIKPASIAFITEMPFLGTIPRTHENMRTEFAWMCALNATHYSVDFLIKNTSLVDFFDLIIIIFPKKGIKGFVDSGYSLVQLAKQKADKVAFMQEGPHWFYQDLPIAESFWLLSEMALCDVFLAHNEASFLYYKGLFKNKPGYINRTLMIEDAIPPLLEGGERKNIIVGGNIIRWYGGLSSYIVAEDVIGELSEETEIWFPSMGRKTASESLISGIHHLPYLSWGNWMEALNKFKVGLHLNPNTAADSFALNCAYLGIPCIGNKQADTQAICFPELAIDPEDFETARALLKRVLQDKDFYQYVSTEAKKNYKTYFSESVFLASWSSFLSSLKNKK